MNLFNKMTFLIFRRPFRNNFKPYVFVPNFFNSSNIAQKPNKELEELKRIPEFELAMSYALKQNYDLSKNYFAKVLEILNMNESTSPGILLLVLKKYSIILKILGGYEELTNVLEQIFFLNFTGLSYFSHGFLPTLRNLFVHYTKFDLTKGLALSNLILEEHIKNPIPLGFLKEIYLQIGNIHALKGGNSLEKALYYYQEALDLGFESNPVLKAITMNNRAIVKWWAYFEEVEKQFLMLEQLDKQAEGDSLDISDEKLYLERRTGQENFQKLQKSAKELYIDIVANFKLCLQSLEDLSSTPNPDISPANYAKLTPEEYSYTTLCLNDKVTLNLQTIKPELVRLLNEISPRIAMNLGEFLFQLGSLQEATFWLQISLNNAAKRSNLAEVMRGMVLIAMGSQNDPKRKDFVEQLYKDCLDYSHQNNPVNTPFCLENYSEFLFQQNRNFEASEYKTQASNIRAKLKPWESRSENLILLDYDLNF